MYADLEDKSTRAFTGQTLQPNSTSQPSSATAATTTTTAAAPGANATTAVVAAPTAQPQAPSQRPFQAIGGVAVASI